MNSLSRRTFLIGAAAALAATRVDLASSSPEVTVAKAANSFRCRSVYDLMIAPDCDMSVTVEILRKTRNGEFPLLHFGIGPRGLYRWVASERDELTFLDDQVFGVRTTPSLATVELEVTSFIDRPDQGPQEFVPGHWQNVYEDVADDDAEEPDSEPIVVGRAWIKPYWRTRRRSIIECYRWRGDDLLSKTAAVLDPRDSGLVAATESDSL